MFLCYKKNVKFLDSIMPESITQDLRLSHYCHCQRNLYDLLSNCCFLKLLAILFDSIQSNASYVRCFCFFSVLYYCELCLVSVVRVGIIRCEPMRSEYFRARTKDSIVLLMRFIVVRMSGAVAPSDWLIEQRGDHKRSVTKKGSVTLVS